MDISSLDYVNFRRIFERGTAEVIEEDDELLFFFDTISETYMLACDDGERAKAVLDKHASRGYEILTTTSKDAVDHMIAKYGFENIEECYQFAYTGEKPELDPRLTFRTADLSDLPVIAESYDMISEDDIAANIERGVVLLAYEGETLVGFIGEHLEGSVGMLFVYPEHRFKGYATALENAVFARMIDQGLIPFGQVISDNEASLSLQKKNGLTMGSRKVYWTW